jgi:hypothetical protein
VKRKLLGADVRLTQGTVRALLRTPPEKRKKAVDELVEQGELPRAKEARPSARPKEVAQSLVTRLQKKGEGHARTVLQRMVRLPGMELVKEEEEK